MNIGKFLATIMAPYNCWPRLEKEMVMVMDVVVMVVVDVVVMVVVDVVVMMGISQNTGDLTCQENFTSPAPG